jgi:hypothetical protein
MSANHTSKARTATALLLAAVFVAILATLPGSAIAATGPVKLLPSGSLTNGFEYSRGVAVNNDAASPEYGDVYVVDGGNRRVQVLTSSGVFVEMFGWDVNATRDAEPTATQAEKNICTAASKDTCQAGVEGTAAGQFLEPFGVAVDPASGDVYITERFFAEGELDMRVQKFTAEGQFLLEIGKDVNHTHKTNLCTEEEVEKEGVQCGAPAGTEAGGPSENSAFQFEQGPGNLLAVGGLGDLLYVGDEHRVQEFEADGNWAGEISLAGISSATRSDVQALALDEETGDLYLTYSQDLSLVREFDAQGSEVASFQVSPREPGRGVKIQGLAVDASGHLAVLVNEDGAPFGALYNTTGNRLLTEFTVPNGAFISGIAFSAEGDLYAADAGYPWEVFAYAPKPVAELVVSPGSCTAAGGVSVVFDCTLAGEVDPEGIAETEALFEWGTTPALGQTTPAQQVTAPEAIQAMLTGLRPNQKFYYRLAGHDQNAKAPEGLQSERASVATLMVPPRVVGTPSVSYVTASSADLSGEVDPENATTTYEFQYAKACAPSEPCPPLAQAPGMVQTTSLQSTVYGATGITQEITGLQPATSYRYQLAAVNEHGQGAVNQTGGTALPEGTFTTAPAPTPQAASGTASGVGTSTATLSGSINPDGLPATYSFELGVYEGTATQYGIVLSAPAGAASTPVQETLAIGGLQPGVTYAFRIAVHSGYIPTGTTYGEPVLFTTSGVPSPLIAPTPLAQLPVPAIAFPNTVSAAKSKKTKTKTNGKHKAGKQENKRKNKRNGSGKRKRARVRK